MRPLNVEVPEALQLHRRGTLCKLDTNMSLKEQVAVAYDEWLTRQGYPLAAEGAEGEAS